MGRCRYSSVDFCPTFFTAIPPTPTLPCLQMAPMRFLPPTLVFAAKAQSVFSLASMLHQWVQEMAQHIGWELIFFVRLLSPSSSASSTVARWLGVCWPGSGKLSALGRSSSKLGCSGEFMCLRLGDGLSFFLTIFLCQSFRQILEAGIYWLTAF